MRNTTKGALAAGTAAALLLGGAGSLAYWTSASTLTVGSIKSGSLALSAADCGTGWTYTTVGAKNPAVVTVVPGDTITRTCTFKVTATGDNLKATLTTPPATVPTTSLTLKPTTVYTIGDPAVPLNGTDNANSITSADEGKTVTAVITVDIPFGTPSDQINYGKTGQGITATLDTINVSLVQTS